MAAAITRSTYTTEEIEKALWALSNRNNAERAAAELAEEGLAVSPRLLRKWRQETHADRYAEIQGERRATLARQLSGEALALAQEEKETEALAVRELRSQLEGAGAATVVKAEDNDALGAALDAAALSSRELQTGGYAVDADPATVGRAMFDAGVAVTHLSRPVAVKDPAAAARNIAQASEYSVKSSRLLADEPTAITENRSAEELVKGLVAAGVLVPTDTHEIDLTIPEEDIEDGDVEDGTTS